MLLNWQAFPPWKFNWAKTVTTNIGTVKNMQLFHSLTEQLRYWYVFKVLHDRWPKWEKLGQDDCVALVFHIGKACLLKKMKERKKNVFKILAYASTRTLVRNLQIFHSRGEAIYWAKVGTVQLKRNRVKKLCYYLSCKCECLVFLENKHL